MKVLHFVGFAVAVAACDSTPPTGAAGGACYGNGTCDGELVCVRDTCNPPIELAPDAGGDDTGGDGSADELDGGIDATCADGERLCDGTAVYECVEGAWTVTEECGPDAVCDDGACVSEAGDCATTCGTGDECDGQDCGDGGSCYFGTCLEADDCFLDEGWCTNAFNIFPGFVGCSSTELGVDSRSSASYCNGPGGPYTDIGALAPEQVWGYLPQQPGMRRVTVVPLTDWDVGLYVTSGHCLPSYQCFEEVDAAGPGQPETITFYGATQNSYAIFVDGVRDGTVGGGTVAGPYVITME